jgi:hypothetical protein
MTFNAQADFYERRYLHPAEYSGDKKSGPWRCRELRRRWFAPALTSGDCAPGRIPTAT